MTLELLRPLFTVYKLKSAPSADILSNEFCFFSKTDRELSLVCPSALAVDDVIAREDDWRAFRIDGQLDFPFVGFFAVSTFDTDYVFIKEKQLYPAYRALSESGYEIKGIEAFARCVAVVNKFLSDIAQKLGNVIQTAYVTGSTVYDDFHPGFSDLDFFFIAARTLTEADFHELHKLYTQYRALGDGWFSALEGEILSPESLESSFGPTVYWGTGKDRFADRYTLSGFSMRTLLERGILLTGPDLRERIPVPDDACILRQSRHLLATVRKYALEPNDNPRYADWIFLLSQTMYTLSTGKQTSKTRAARWLKSVSTDPLLMKSLEKAEEIRMNPANTDKESLKMLKNPIQFLADKLDDSLRIENI